MASPSAARTVKPIAPPQRFGGGGTPSRFPSRGRVLVSINLARDPLGAAAANGATQRALSGRLNRREAMSLRQHRRGAVRRVIAAHEAARRTTIKALEPPLRRTAVFLSRAVRAVDRVGGTVMSVQYAGPSVIAEIPATRVRNVAEHSEARSISPAPLELPMGGLANETAAVGAPTWWSSGHNGGTGTADLVAVNLAVMDDKIEEDQPLFQGVIFERPMNTSAGTSCGQGSAGCIHGTEVAGMAVATGNANCTSLCTSDTAGERGVAYGASHVLDADFGTAPDAGSCGFDSALWALGFAQPPIGICTHSMPGAPDPAYVHSDSHGGYTSRDDSAFEQNLDKFTSTFGAIQTEPSGNDGTADGGSGRITDSCIAYNVICTGGISGNGVGTADDSVAGFSSQGPSPAGRKKPDLVAFAAGSADGNMTVLEQLYVANNRLERGDTGTSFASPQVAGAAALLYGAGLTDPLVVKAILLDSTTLGRATTSSAMGTQTTWQPDWGWGELNLDSAYQQRDNFQAASVGAQSVRFYRATVGAGDRATLVWNRRVGGAPDQTAVPQPLTLSNLDLYEYTDDSSQTQQEASESTIDNVEQVRAPAAGTVVYKVKDQSSVVDGLPGEPFALAAKNPLTELTAPTPAVSVTLDRSQIRQGDAVTLTETVRNTSSDMDGSATVASLDLPAGVTVVSGGSTTWSPGGGTLATGASDSHEWTVRGDADGSYQLRATAQDGAYGETFSSSALQPLTVDSTAPVPSLECPAGGGTATSLPVEWSATDSSGIAGFDVEVSVNGGPYSPWLSGSNLGSATYPGTAGSAFSFRVRATDGLGNTSGFVSCGPVSIGFVAVPPVAPMPTPAKPLPASPHLALRRIRVGRGRIELDGRLIRGATGTVRCTYTAHRGKLLRGHARVRRGAYRIVLKVRHLRRPGIFRIDYSGDRSFAPQHISRRLK